MSVGGAWLSGFGSRSYMLLQLGVTGARAVAAEAARFPPGVSGPLHVGSPCGPVASVWSDCNKRAQNSKDTCPQRIRPHKT